MDSYSIPDINRAPEDECEDDTLNQGAQGSGTKRKENPETGASSQAQPSKSKKKATPAPRSAVWDHFKRLDENRDKCRCKHCGKLMSCLTTSGTSNLTKHLASCKPYQASMDSQSQQVINQGSEGNLSFGKVSEKIFREASNELLVLAELPLAFIECMAWKHFCDKVKLYKPHSRRTATRDIVQMYVRRKAELKKMFAANKQRLSLTTDIWVAPTTNASYMVITAHYIDAAWKMRNLIIGFKNVPDHKGSTIAITLLDFLSEWGIKKVFAITVDNATANSNALDLFKEDFKEVGLDSLVLNGECLHVRCCAHILNLVVKDGLKEVNNSVTAIRNAVTYVRASGNRLKSFEQRVEVGRVMSRGSLPLDVNTRWNSTYLMLSKALSFSLAFDRMHAEDKLYNDYFEEVNSGKKRIGPPSTSDWNAVANLVKFLIIFYNSTLVVSASNTSNSFKCYNEIVTIERNLRFLAISSDEDLRKKASAMIDKFDKYWGVSQINKLLIIASVLDPRNKLHFAQLCFEKLYGKESPEFKKMYDDVVALMCRLFDEYSVYIKVGVAASSGSSSQTSQSLDPVSLDRMDLGYDYVRMDSLYQEMITEKGLDEASDELELYLKEKVENPKNTLPGIEFDVLSWWKLNSGKFLVLSEVAKDVLAVQVSFVASESAFSTSDRILDPYRSCLTHYMLEVLMCTEQWLKVELQFGEQALFTNKQILEDFEMLDTFEKEFGGQSDLPTVTR